MKQLYLLFFLAGLIAGGLGLALWASGCDEITPPCDEEHTQSGLTELEVKYLESWRIENGKGVLKFVWPTETVFFVCTDRTLDYELTFEKRFDTTVFTVLPEARLIWKYEAPKPGKALLEGRGDYQALFDFNAKTTNVNQYRIALAYNEGAFGGTFVPGAEIRIPTSGNMSDDYQFIWDNFLLAWSYKVSYRTTF